ncbi:hypothetical protein Axy21_015 [Achromobacter phage vB_AxyP_19-32_Axy21]|uniref:Uncharacterized protein n=1 Tax=Achromobacter phage vB_AxyP_19-32_Axy21 TaxID=2591045 RepID=A0A514CVP5_9CAUD|nr:hypothetical protein Axy21_015 [Achromobacter phage vB_AxyP_19-32_Axy21]
MSKIKGMAIQLAQTKSKLEKSTRSVGTLTTQNKVLTDAIETQRTTINHLSDRLRMARGIAQDLKAKMDTAQAATSQLLEENTLLRDQISVLQVGARKDSQRIRLYRTRWLRTMVVGFVLGAVVLALLTVLTGG